MKKYYIKKVFFIITVVSLINFKSFILVDFLRAESNKTFDFSKNNSISLFKINEVLPDNLQPYIGEFTSLTIDLNQLKKTIENYPYTINLEIPKQNGQKIELVLSQNEILAPYFQAYNNNGINLTLIENQKNIFYKGTVKGYSNSIVALSFFENFVMGIISLPDGNYVLGPLKDSNKKMTDKYIFYNDNDLKIKDNFTCSVSDFDGVLYKGNSNFYKKEHQNSNNLLTTDAINIYFVADNQMYIDNGYDMNQVANFVQGIFNGVSVLYQNENIPVKISRIDVYTLSDPYISLSDSYQILLAFGENTKDNYYGDLAHLLSSGHQQLLGGIAWINVLCQSYNPVDNSGRFAFSNIENSYLPFPTYSWSVMVVTHETGHNIASRHTHACVWPVYSGGELGSIDTCVITEENQACYSPGTQQTPIMNGTIMSYCHIGGSISFLNGFGQLPGDTVRLGYQLAVCLDSALNSSQVPLNFSLLQNFPNPFNPVTNIRFDMPIDGFVSINIYDISGKQISSTLLNKFYFKGSYSVLFDSQFYNLSSGIYLYEINIKNTDNVLVYYNVKRMVLVK